MVVEALGSTISRAVEFDHPCRRLAHPRSQRASVITPVRNARSCSPPADSRTVHHYGSASLRLEPAADQSAAMQINFSILARLLRHRLAQMRSAPSSVEHKPGDVEFRKPAHSGKSPCTSRPTTTGCVRRTWTDGTLQVIPAGYRPAFSGNRVWKRSSARARLGQSPRRVVQYRYRFPEHGPTCRVGHAASPQAWGRYCGDRQPR